LLESLQVFGNLRIHPRHRPAAKRPPGRTGPGPGVGGHAQFLDGVQELRLSPNPAADQRGAGGPAGDGQAGPKAAGSPDRTVCRGTGCQGPVLRRPGRGGWLTSTVTGCYGFNKGEMVGALGPRLSRLQERAIAALLTSPTFGEAAEQIKGHPNTLRAWCRQEGFALAYAAAREQLLAKTVGKLQHAVFA